MWRGRSRQSPFNGEEGAKLCSHFISETAGAAGSFYHSVGLWWLLSEEQHRGRIKGVRNCWLRQGERERERETGAWKKTRAKDQEKLQMNKGATEGPTSAAKHHPATFSFPSISAPKRNLRWSPSLVFQRGMPELRSQAKAWQLCVHHTEDTHVAYPNRSSGGKVERRGGSSWVLPSASTLQHERLAAASEAGTLPVHL